MSTQGRHIRHVGNGDLAFFVGDKDVRDLGVTPGWDFRDRDEVIARFNAFEGLNAEITRLRASLAAIHYHAKRKGEHAIWMECEEAVPALRGLESKE